ncbi:kelch repeat-containing protein [Streptomyces sp. NPDC046332]|uniref:kelch repeat-containing protein n=1 Tax=Streptomyces sp. NPDC046332 TaxID=3155133 RepID=UPI00340DAB38
MYAVGGTPLSGPATATAEAYSTDTNTWLTLPDMPTGRDDGPGAAYAPYPEGLSNGCVYVMGGLDDTFTTSDTTDAYSPVANTWVSLPSMPTPHREMGAAAAPCPRNVKRDCVYALAGYFDGANISGTTEAFAIERAEVTQPKPAPTPTPTSTSAAEPSSTPTPDSRPDSRPKETPAQSPAKTDGARIQVPALAQDPVPAASPSPSASPAKPVPAATPAPAAKPAPAGTPTSKPSPTAKPSPKPTPPVTTTGMRP